MNENGHEEKQQGSADQRQHLRRPLLIQKVFLDDGHKTFFGYAKNLSRSGVFISTVNPREPGEQFRLEIPLPPPLPTPVQVTCEVVWKRLFSRSSEHEPGMGLRFLDLPSELGTAIDNWIIKQSQ